MEETMFDGMEGWAKEYSKIGLTNLMVGVLTGMTYHPRDEKVMNQLLTFIVRDLEKQS